MLERAYISSNLSFVKLEDFKFKHISSSRKIDFSSLSLSLETSLLSFGLNILSISRNIELYFLAIQTMELGRHGVWNLSIKTCRVFEFRVAHSSTSNYWQSTFDLATLIFVQKNQTFNRMNLLICITFLIENYETSTWSKKSWNVYRGHSMHAFHE